MGMGTAPGFGYFISTDDLKAICPEGFDKLTDTLAKHNVTLDDLARAIERSEELADVTEVTENGAKEIIDAITFLCEQFESKTTVFRKGEKSALTLSLMYYDKENGDLYDDLDDGANWTVEGSTELSPAGKKFESQVQPKQWTTFG